MPRRRPGTLLPLEIGILRACGGAGPDGVHGFAIATTIAEGTASRRLTATGTLYRALQRLEERGLIESRWEDPELATDAGRPRRRLYRLTGAGAVALAATAVDQTDQAFRLEPGSAT